ncbi:hydroxylysine kinase-like [Macrosteles quadrilineatus]|uniref:hydroxylysine kinase-like n=1 Tax=Macrosteles quadrilineatus TaxID=74068 RepID=UPI0023E1F720|nr:hydroxylysine kinase-like [Macrosteles quadrilineatus]XP_054277231.1 hydroxylysine kinase-like [Macrosteles quadrilineatus]XP_054277233.1 hydroxylysine kinase-like [Macrosteles quadrilineatus]XP_054277234.1 hydroxylysine kinase-like [Macrosteles quadrilineatus]
MADQIVAPGEEIKPKIRLAEAITLAEHLYGIDVCEAKELDGYDDKNYHLKAKSITNNKNIPHISPHGYVLKIMNSSDSEKIDCVQAQCEIMIHLGNNGIQTPQPQKSTDGSLFCIQELPQNNKDNKPSKKHAVRLLTFVDGKMLKDLPWTLKFHFDVGVYTARLDLVLQNFSHPAYKQYSSLWMLKNMPTIEDYLFVFKETDKRIEMVKEVVQSFKDQVLKNLGSLKSGMIHGDIHDQNLLCQLIDGEWSINAVLDFGDSHYSAYVIELALATAYMILQSGLVESGTHVIAGYCSILPLPLDELKLLKVCVCARLCQSLVLGLYTHSLYPSNDYVLTTQAGGWQLLTQIWTMDRAALENQWFAQLPREHKIT